MRSMSSVATQDNFYPFDFVAIKNSSKKKKQHVLRHSYLLEIGKDLKIANFQVYSKLRFVRCVVRPSQLDAGFRGSSIVFFHAPLKMNESGEFKCFTQNRIIFALCPYLVSFLEL